MKREPGCTTCGRGGTLYPGPHAPWCETVRRGHHDADVRDRHPKGHNRAVPVRDFDRWGWELA